MLSLTSRSSSCKVCHLMLLKHALLTDFYMSRRRSRREREEGTRIPNQYILLHEQEQDKEEQEEEEEGREKDPLPIHTFA